MRRSGLKYSALFNWILAFSLCAISCTPSSSNGQATQLPETREIENTPFITASPEATQGSPLPRVEIDTRMAKLVDFVPLAGIAIGIQYKGEIYENGYGLADIETGTPVMPQTIFKIASLTKSFTAATILHLQEEGTLSLSDPISAYIPGGPEFAEDIQVQHLLNHTSGLPDWSIDTAQAALPESFTTAQAVEYYFSTIQSLEFEPGEAWSYNNAGYFLLGAILENVSGMPYEEYLQATFFAPLALDSSGECGSPSDSVALGYHAANKQLEPANPSNLKLGGAASALCSNVGDLLGWLDALSHGEVIEDESWEQMITATELPDGGVEDYGFGLVIQEGSQGLEISHDGATAGFNSYFAYYPEHQLSIVLLSNTDGFDPPLRGIASSLVSDLLRK